MRVIYGDVLFLVNFSMDYLALGLTGKLTHQPLSRLRLLSAASFGGIYGVCAVFLQGNSVIGLLLGILASLFLCYVAFDRRAKASLAVFYGVSFLLGGAMTALWTLYARLRGAYTDPSLVSESISGGIPLGAVLLLAALSGLIASIAGRIAKKKQSEAYLPFAIGIGGKALRSTALCDTGNLLAEPISGDPVLLLPKENAETLFRGSALGEALVSSSLSGIPPGIAPKIRLIPMRTVGNETVLLALRPDYAEVDGEEVRLLFAFADIPTPLLPSSLCTCTSGTSRKHKKKQ